MSLAGINNFGGVAAEDDAILQYFLSTDVVTALKSGHVLLVLGRKGTGKTALVRFLTESQGSSQARSLNLRGYPWNVHAARIDHGATTAEAYVSSWRYLLAVQLASVALAQAHAWRTEEAVQLTNFLNDNYGGTQPQLADILRPANLKLSKVSFLPAIMGNQLGGIDLDRKGNDLQFGVELAALSGAIIAAAFGCLSKSKSPPVSLHFDELDQGISALDEPRRSMLVGLVIAARDIRRAAQAAKVRVDPIVYLRSDLWTDLQFSDKNKITQSASYTLEWDSQSLMALVDLRLKAKLGPDATWEKIAEPDRMRGSQSKWNHILARTFLRPRDVISFLNLALDAAKARDPNAEMFTNTDISAARDRYSSYLKAELDDEIVPHWASWTEALRACSAIGTLSFLRDQFRVEYGNRKGPQNPMSADEALALLYQFSVAGYRTPRSGGGSAWVFHYSDPNSGYDNVATQFKVHPGLKEFAKLREDRNPTGTDLFALGDVDDDLWLTVVPSQKK
jgi:hypothetical protein